ncbi:MAG: hypothetical protein ONB11_12080 [candidate division KSB1 bacterium]|nr:hypothetical protein [candidate division KSB1 bacterium]
MIIDLKNEYVDPENNADILTLWNKLYPDSQRPNGQRIDGYLSDKMLEYVGYRIALEREGGEVYRISAPRDMADEKMRIQICNTWLLIRFGKLPGKLWYYDADGWSSIVHMEHNVPFILITCGKIYNFRGGDRYVAYLHLSLDPDHYMLGLKWGNSDDYHVSKMEGEKYYHADYRRIDAETPTELKEKIDEEIRFLKDNVVYVDENGIIHREASTIHVMVVNRSAEIIQSVE